MIRASWSYPNKFILGAVLLLASLILLPAAAGSAAAADVPEQPQSEGNGKDVEVPENMTPEQVDDYLAGLSDEKAREALAAQLKKESAAQAAPDAGAEDFEEEEPGEHIFHDMYQGVSNVLDQIASFLTSEKEGSLKWQTVVNRLSGGKGAGHLVVTLLIGIGIIVCGVVIERLVVGLTGNLRKQILAAAPLGKLHLLGRLISRLLLDALGLVAYISATFLLLLLFFRQEDAGYWVVSNLLIASYYILVIMFASRMIMSPTTPALRLLPLQDWDAKFLHRWIVRITLVAAVFLTPGIIFHYPGRSQTLFDLFYIASGLSVSLLMIAMIWQSRKRVAEAICTDDFGGVCDESSLRTKFSRTWHYFAILYVAGSGTFWLINTFWAVKARSSI